MIIYLDIVLLENLLMNYIIIFSTAILTKSKINHKNIFISSLIAGVYSILNYIWNLGEIESNFIKLLISLLIVLISFDCKKFKTYVKKLIFFYIISFIYGGISFMLLFLINPLEVNFYNGLLVGTYPMKILLISGIVGVIIIAILSYIIKDRMKIKSMVYDLEISYSGKNVILKTMIDSGNMLKEPISGNDVIIVEKLALSKILPTDILDNIDNILNGKWIGGNDEIYKCKLKIIPFSSLGNENGMMIGFKPDYIKILDETEIVKNNVVVGIYNGKLSRNNLYSSLIGLEILK